MPGAFQASAFQADAFQVGGGVALSIAASGGSVSSGSGDLVLVGPQPQEQFTGLPVYHPIFTRRRRRLPLLIAASGGSVSSGSGELVIVNAMTVERFNWQVLLMELDEDLALLEGAHPVGGR